MNVEQMISCALLVLCGTLIIMIPFSHYVVAGWSARRKDIMDGFDADACVEYFKMFGRSGTTPLQRDQAESQFLMFHARWYGRRFFAMPGVLLLLISLIGVAWLVFTGLDMLKYFQTPPITVVRLPITAMAAAAGAYLWVANDLISRARRLDMAPSDVMWAVMRLAIAIPMGYAFARIATDRLAPFIAFALGAFPLAQLTSMLQRLTNKSLGLEATAAETTDDIIKLQGINRAIVERLSNEDINTITQIAYCDPVRLIMRSSLTFNFVTDCMNQALAWMYLQSDLDILRPLGMRGAVEMRSLIEEFDDAAAIDPERRAAHDRAVAAFPLFAGAVKQDPATLQQVFRQIAEDPYTKFLVRVWN